MTLPNYNLGDKVRIHHNIAGALGYDLVRRKKSHDKVEYHLSKLLKKLEIDLVLDVGANEGQFARSLRNNSYTGDIISFEPVKKVFGHLKTNAKGDSRWQQRNFALGEEESEIVINVPNSTVFTSFLSPKEYTKERFDEHFQEMSQEKVQIYRLDDSLKKEGIDLTKRNVFLKLDTQGFDLAVLKGAMESIHSVKGLQTELSFVPLYDEMPSYLEMLQFLDSNGFVITGIFPVSRDESSLKLIEADCVLIRS